MDKLAINGKIWLELDYSSSLLLAYSFKCLSPRIQQSTTGSGVEPCTKLFDR